MWSARRFGVLSRWSRTFRWCSVASGIQLAGASSQDSTWCQAVAMGSGRSKMRGLDTRRAKASRLDHGRPSGAVPFSLSSSQVHAARCWSKSATWAYTNRLASTSLTERLLPLLWTVLEKHRQCCQSGNVPTGLPWCGEYGGPVDWLF